MSTVDQILGRKPVQEDDVPPVMAARTRPASMLRKQEPRDKEEKKLRDKARRSSVIAHIIGMAESDDEGIIPDDAKRVDPFSTNPIAGMTEKPELNNDSPAEPSLTDGRGETLIPPTAALVAPDVTPKVFELIDPSQVPAPPKPEGTPAGPPTITPEPSGEKGALDTILGRQNPAPTERPIVPGQAPVTVESFMHAVNPLEVKAKVADKLVPASAGGSAMPVHQEGDGKTIYNVVRSILG